MSIIRDVPFVIEALKDTILVTCSAIMSTAGSTSPKGMLSVESTDGALVDAAGTGTTAFGRVIDRLRFPLGTMYAGAVVGATLHSSRGSTEADRKLTIAARLQHGDSSGGGDMADLSTASNPDTRQYFSTARTTDMLQWDGSESSGPVYAAANPGVYDIRKAKQYLRIAVPVSKNRVTTESSGDEQARVRATLAFVGGANLPQKLDTEGPYSTSTST